MQAMVSFALRLLTNEAIVLDSVDCGFVMRQSLVYPPRTVLRTARIH